MNILYWLSVICTLLGWTGPGALAIAAAPTKEMTLMGATSRDSAILRADKSRLALTLPDGMVLYSQDLVGATLQLDGGRLVRIDTVEVVSDLHGQPLWMHTLSTPDAQGNWRNLCMPHPDGSRFAMVVPGKELYDDTIGEDDQAFTISCTGGAQGKCLRFGYLPWQRFPNGTTYRAIYNACIRMVRADYGGEGHGYTENGMPIDVYDDFGIQTTDNLSEHDFEAGWGPAGAVCVRHVRVAKNVTLEQLGERYPTLKGRIGKFCTEDFARRHGALLFNRSDPRGVAPISSKS